MATHHLPGKTIIRLQSTHKFAAVTEMSSLCLVPAAEDVVHPPSCSPWNSAFLAGDTCLELYPLKILNIIHSCPSA